MKKVPMNLYFSTDTIERLRKYAENHHTTVSQAITDWIWEQEISTSDFQINDSGEKMNESKKITR